jgi:hypothetical protein
MLDRTSAVDRLIREWSPQRLFGTPHFDLIHRAIHMISSRHMTHMLDLVVPWAANARMPL